MLCDDCKKNEACVHITQISNEGKIEKNLCKDCAEKYGKLMLNTGKDFSVNDFLKGIFSNDGQQMVAESENNELSQAVCPNCGMSYRDFMHTGKIGCSVCYSTFGKRLEPLLRRIHGSSIHNGKIPQRSGGELNARHELIVLRQKLNVHVANEEYEKAAQLRDQIRELEGQLEHKEQGADQ